MHSYSSYLNRIDPQQASMLNLLKEWAEINSWSENISGLAEILTAMKPHFAKLGGTMKEVSLPPKMIINDLGMLAPMPIGKALSITKRPEAPIQVFLGGHMDTVYSPHHAFQKTQLVASDKLQGPGVADMKGGLIVMLKALETFEQHPHASRIGWEILINPDEEIGSVGSEPLLIASAQRNSLGLIFEPSFADGAIVNSRKGSANFTLTAKGKAAHSGREFEKGRSAIVALADAIKAIDSLNDREKGITVNVGYISGGGPVNIVPEHAICRINVRTIHERDFIEVQTRLQNLDKEIVREGIVIKMYLDHTHSPKLFDEKNKILFENFKQCASQEGLDLIFRPSGGACDGNLLSAKGLPVIDTLGAIGGNIHTSEEYILKDSLVLRARLVCLFLLKLAAGDF